MPEESDSTSNNGNQWVSSLLETSLKINPLVTQGVIDRLEILLNGQISERDLTPTNLKAIAEQLIADMVPNMQELEETE